MATRTIEKRVCDRPGCGTVLTDRGGRFDLASEFGPPGPAKIVEDSIRGVDLCRSCAESLSTWWTSIERRASEKAGGAS